MTNERPAGGAADPAAPLDSSDEALLREVASLLDEVDPVPADLVERARFALALDEVYDEVARMVRVADQPMAVRTDTAGEVRTNSISFTADRLTAMVTVSALTPGQVRLDGWVYPGGARRVAVRMQGWSDEVLCDNSGRFVVDAMPAAFVQLVFHPRADEPGGPVVTPLFKA